MNFQQQENSLSGVVAVPATPFRRDGGIDEAAYQRIIRRLVEAGITTVTPNGNTGEFYALSSSEAKVVTRLALEAVDPETTVIVGVGHDVASAREAARDALATGAALVMVHQPVHPYVSVDGWIEYHRAIASDVPDLGVVLYVRNEAIPGSAFARLGELCPNVIGVKYAVPSPVHFAQVASDAGAGRFTWVAGAAELHAPGYFAVGATGFTSGLANVDPSTSLRLWQALVDGAPDVVTDAWHRVRPFEEMRAANSSANNVSVVKEALCQLGICGRDIRPPSSLLSAKLRSQVTEILEDWGMLP
ncbi:MAG: dihydrodipicolinate synthase family protein [Acidimicrobiales bacterium]|jgi:4-hydroxy-tetrahydrodipicolinate synthase